MAKKRPNIDTLIISDIHLGFRFSRAADVLKVLKGYNFEHLILNGDIFEDLNFNRLHSEHWEVLSYLRHLSKSKEVVWIVGNHDGRSETLSHLLGINFCNKYVWWSNGRKFLAIHGHQFDRFVSKNLIISSLADFLYILLKRLENKNQVISQWIRHHNRSWLRMSKDVARRAIHYARLRRVDCIFCGHTHQAYHLKSKKVEYYNSGCWTEYPANFITIKDGKIKLREVA